MDRPMPDIMSGLIFFSPFPFKYDDLPFKNDDLFMAHPIEHGLGQTGA
jgi:hypothetical protein